MTTAEVPWAAVVASDAALAEYVERRFSTICYLATVRADGNPRVHPVGVMFRRGRALVAMGANSRKAGDLRADGRYAVHCTVEDSRGGAGEVLLRGRAAEVDAPEDFVAQGWLAFELRIAEILTVRRDAASELVVAHWRPDGARSGRLEPALGDRASRGDGRRGGGR